MCFDLVVCTGDLGPDRGLDVAAERAVELNALVEVLDLPLDLLDQDGDLRLTPQNRGDYQTLVEILGADDLLDAFTAFQRELRRYAETPAATRPLLRCRCSLTTRQFSTGCKRQRHVSARTISPTRGPSVAGDAGMPVLARDLVYTARVEGRRGREMLSIGIDLVTAGDLIVTVQHRLQVDMTASASAQSPWAMEADGDPHELSMDLQ